MHLKRWITGIIAVPILFVILYYGGRIGFGVLIGAVACLALAEYFGIVYAGKNSLAHGLFRMAGYAAALALLTLVFNGLDYWVPLVLVADLAVVGIVAVSYYKNDSSLPEGVAYQVLGLVYIPLLASYLISLRNAFRGGAWLFCLLVVVAAGDIGAYYVGSYLGRNKLCPAVSPKKTVEGALGGLAGNLLAGTCFKLWLLTDLGWLQMAVFALTVGLLGQVGDLFESAFKRRSGIKDSGRLLPGHGGFLDRIDALLFAAPAAYFLQQWILK